MELNLKTGVIAVVVLLGLGYGAGRYLQPADIKTEIKEVVKEVEVVKKDVITKIIERKNTDGSITKETVITDKTTIDKESEKKRDEVVAIINQKPQYRISGGAGFDFKEKEPQYVIGFEKRFWGPVSLGLDTTVSPSMDFKSANIKASFEF